MYRIKLPESVAALLRSLHPDLKKKTRAALRALSKKPQEGKTLREDLEGLRSYRVGRLRIIYRTTAKKIIEVVAIGPRKRIYEETLRILKKESKKSL